MTKIENMKDSTKLNKIKKYVYARAKKNKELMMQCKYRGEDEQVEIERWKWIEASEICDYITKLTTKN